MAAPNLVLLANVCDRHYVFLVGVRKGKGLANARLAHVHCNDVWDTRAPTNLNAAMGGNGQGSECTAVLNHRAWAGVHVQAILEARLLVCPALSVQVREQQGATLFELGCGTEC